MFTFKKNQLWRKKKFSSSRKTLAGLCYDNIISVLRHKELYDNKILKDSFNSRLDFLTLLLAIVIKQLLIPNHKQFFAGQRFLFSRDLIEIAINDIDGNMRQMGVGDMKFSKKMKNIALNLTAKIKDFTNINNQQQLSSFIQNNLVKRNIQSPRQHKKNEISPLYKGRAENELNLWLLIISQLQGQLSSNGQISSKSLKKIINISFPKQFLLKLIPIEKGNEKGNEKVLSESTKPQQT